MASVTNRIAIRRPIDDVFAVMTDVEKTGTWFPGDVQEHWTSAPPHGVGSTRHAVVKMMGRTTENDAVTTVYEPPGRAAMQGTSPNAPFLVTLGFTRDGELTQVEVVTDLNMHGPGRILGPLVGFGYGRAWARGLANLKRLMESGAL